MPITVTSPPNPHVKPVAPLQRTSGNLAPNSTSWADLDTSGSAAARDLDVIIPASAGDVIYVAPNFVVGTDAVDLYLDVATIVSSAVVNTFSGQAGGIGGWFCGSGLIVGITGPAGYVVQAGDISGGNVRCRMRYKTGAANAKTVYASTAQWPFKIGGGNQGPPA